MNERNNGKSSFPSLLSPFPKNGTSFKRRMDLHTHEQTRHQTEKRGKGRSEQRGGRKKRTSHCVPVFSSSPTFRAHFLHHAKRKRAKNKSANNLGRKKKNKVTQTSRLAFFLFFVQEDGGAALSRLFRRRRSSFRWFACRLPPPSSAAHLQDAFRHVPDTMPH